MKRQLLLTILSYINRDIIPFPIKFTLCLLMICSFGGYATEADTQSHTIKLPSNTFTIGKLVEEIEKQTGYLVIFSNDELDADQTLRVKETTAGLSDLLEEAFRSTDVLFEYDNNYIILSKQLQQQTEEVSISGKVTDMDGEPIIGANIIVLGTTTGNITDHNGDFSLMVPDKSRLRITYIGYITQEITVSGSRTYQIKMKEDDMLLVEVVAIGYGTKTKSTLTGSISLVDKEVLENRPVARTTDLLQGVVPGVQITRSNSGRIKGTNSAISIRGVTSRNNPGVLIVIDGIAQKDTDTYALDNINPEDIENISILKDAQAAIYGARAAGGVILITTKKGITDKPTIQFTGSYTIQKPSLMKKGTNILQIVEMMNEGFINDGQLTNEYTHIAKYIADNNLTMDEIKKNNGKYSCQWPFDSSADFVFGHYDWPDIMFDPAGMQNYNLSVSGKTDKLNYYNSIGYVNQNSMLNFADNKNKRLFVKLKNDYQINKYLQVKTIFDFERQKITEPSEYGQIEFWQGLIWPVFMPYNSKGHLYNFGSHQNPIGYARDGGSLVETNHRVKALGGLVLTPLKDLSITAEISSSFDIRENEFAFLGFDMYDENDKYSYNSKNGRNEAGSTYDRLRYTIANVYANYSYTLLRNNKFDLMAGYSHEEEDWRKFDARRRLGLISSELPTFGLGDASEQYNSESKLDRALNSFFSRLSYSYKNRYLLDATFRYDGSSRLAKGHRWAPFYGISGAWAVSGENFMQEINDIINFLKIRASWGQMGNEASVGYYDYIAQINISGQYPMGNSLSPTPTQSAVVAGMASATRTWEKINTKNIGLDIATLHSRLSATVDLYIKDNPNMFFTKEFPQVLGIVAPSINGAHVRAKGWEVTLGWNDRLYDLDYSISLNLSNNTNKVISLEDSGIPGHGLNNFVEGYAVGSYFGYKFDGLIRTEEELKEYTSRMSSGVPNSITTGNARFKDMDGDGQLKPQLYKLDSNGNPTPDSGDLIHLGDNGQHYLFGINLNANWRNFDFGMFFQGVLKWDVIESNLPLSGSSWPPIDYFYGKNWNPDNQSAFYPRLTLNPAIHTNDFQLSDAPYLYFNNKYIRLKNIQIGYTIPARISRKVQAEKLRVYFSGTDIWEAHALPGTYDPEKPFNPRITPFPRGYSFGLNITL